LNPRLVKTVLLGYFGHNGYKLLDKSTGAIFKSRDVIFEEGITHLAKQSTPTVLSDDNDLFATRLQQNSNVDIVKDNPKPEPILPTHGIVPRSLPSSELHGTDNDNTPDTNNSTPTTTENPNNDPDNLPLALRKSWRTVKLTIWLQESTEYINRPMVNHILDDNWILRIFKEAMRRPDLW